MKTARIVLVGVVALILVAFIILIGANSHTSSRTKFLSIGCSTCTRFGCRRSRSVTERPAGEGPWQTRGC